MISSQTSASTTAASANISRELRCATLLGTATHYSADFYSFDGARYPSLLELVCQLRDEAFRSVGITLSDSHCIDRSDIDGTCQQLIVWDREKRAIMGGYRYAIGSRVSAEKLPLARYYTLSQRFTEELLPHGIELSRSFINVAYQQRHNPVSIYALDTLWEGLAHIVNSTASRYLFGRVSFYPTLGHRITNLVVGFMQNAFAPSDQLITPQHPIDIGISRRCFKRVFRADDPRQNYRTLLRLVHSTGRHIPPIITSYMRLSPSMRTYEAYINSDLGDIIETAIILDTDNLYDDAKRRYNIQSPYEPTAIV